VYIGTYSRNLIHDPLCRPDFSGNSMVIVKRLRLGSKIGSNRTVCLWACQERGGRDIMSRLMRSGLPNMLLIWSFEVCRKSTSPSPHVPGSEIHSHSPSQDAYPRVVRSNVTARP